MYIFLLSSTSWRGLFYRQNNRRILLDLFEKYLPCAQSGYIRKLYPEDLEVVSLSEDYYGFFTSAGELQIVSTEQYAIEDLARESGYTVHTIQ